MKRFSIELCLADRFHLSKNCPSRQLVISLPSTCCLLQIVIKMNACLKTRFYTIRVELSRVGNFIRVLTSWPTCQPASQLACMLVFSFFCAKRISDRSQEVKRKRNLICNWPINSTYLTLLPFLLLLLLLVCDN